MKRCNKKTCSKLVTTCFSGYGNIPMSRKGLGADSRWTMLLQGQVCSGACVWVRDSGDPRDTIKSVTPNPPEMSTPGPRPDPPPRDPRSQEESSGARPGRLEKEEKEEWPGPAIHPPRLSTPFALMLDGSPTEILIKCWTGGRPKC